VGNQPVREQPEITPWTPNSGKRDIPPEIPPDKDAPETENAGEGESKTCAIDDDSLVLTNTVAMLVDPGHTAIGVSSGKAALENLRRDDSIDLVITDQIMPQMTGPQLTKAIKAEWPGISVILTSGFADTDARGTLGRR
jgi:PleD family two-component response regulator